MPWRWIAAGALGLAPAWGQAEQWTIDNSLSTRYETNDNTSLAQQSPGTMNTLSLSTRLAAARKTESSATRVDAAVAALQQWGPGSQDRIDGQLGLSQSLVDELNSYDLGVQYQQDFNNGPTDADVTVGRGRRRTQTLSGGWSRRLSERLGVNTGLALDRTAYGQSVSGAVDYRNAELSGGVSYRVNEIHTLNLNGGHSDYRTENDSNRATTDQVSLAWSYTVSEKNSTSLSLGVYRTRNQQLELRRVCDLDVTNCQLGLFPYSVVTDRVGNTGRGLQFSLSERYAFDERTQFSFGAARKQAPSGAGIVVRSETLNASVERRFSPTVSGTAAYARSRSTYVGQQINVGRPAQQNLSVSLSRQLADDLSVQAAYQLSRARGTFPGQDARANSVSVSLSYDWPKFDAAR